MKQPFAPHTMDVVPPFYNDLGYKQNGKDASGNMGEIPAYYDDLGYQKPKAENVYGTLNKMPPFYNTLGQQGNVGAGTGRLDIIPPYYDDLRYQQSGYNPSGTRMVDTPTLDNDLKYQPNEYGSLGGTDEISSFYNDMQYKPNGNNYDSNKQQSLFDTMVPSYGSMEEGERNPETESAVAEKRNKGSQGGRMIRDVDLGSFWFWAFIVLCVSTCCGLGGTGVYVVTVGLCDFCYSIICTILFVFLFISIFTILNTSVIIVE